MSAPITAADQWVYRVAMTLLPGIGDINARKLIAFCGGVEAVFRQKRSALEKIPGIGPILADAVHTANVLQRAEAELRYMEKNGVRPVFFLDPEYPARLTACADSPILIFTKGRCELNAPRMVSVVGTRSPTSHGLEFTDHFIEGLVDKGITVVSGLAYGIDFQAHKACLRHQLPTIACLAHGLDTIYPATHRKVALEMLDRGGWVSDFASGTKLHRNNFPSRNRIIAGLADATVVVEAAETGGALITADIASSYNRDVFAVPGRPTDARSAGCNRIIRTNVAALCDSATAFLTAMNWDQEKPRPVAEQVALFPNLSPDEQCVFDALKNGPVQIDALNRKLGWTINRTNQTLSMMEIAGHLISMPGKVYRLAGRN